MAARRDGFGGFAAAVAARLNLKAISDHWQDILRFATSIRTGPATASVILRKVAAYPRQNARRL